MTALEAFLDQLASGEQWSPDWDDVLARADVPARKRVLQGRRSLIAVAIAVAVVLVPLVAVAASQGWWFFAAGAAPQPTHPPVIVTRGIWDGQPWELVAYPSGTDGLCFAVTPSSSAKGNGAGSALACAPFVGLPQTPDTKASPAMTITFLSGSPTQHLPRYIAGPVIESAASVEMHFRNGLTLRTPTFPAPAPLDHIRFYARQLPNNLTSTPQKNPLSWIAGLGRNGKIVACLAPATANNGISPPSACR